MWLHFHDLEGRKHREVVTILAYLSYSWRCELYIQFLFVTHAKESAQLAATTYTFVTFITDLTITTWNVWEFGATHWHVNRKGKTFKPVKLLPRVVSLLNWWFFNFGLVYFRFFFSVFLYFFTSNPSTGYDVKETLGERNQSNLNRTIARTWNCR